MSVATAGALVIGETAEASIVVLLFAIGELLEGVAAGTARSGIKALAALVPRTALLIDGTVAREIPASQLEIGQIVLVRPGDRVPADGDVVEGESDVDECPVTGESMPVPKQVGSPVFAGGINADRGAAGPRDAGGGRQHHRPHHPPRRGGPGEQSPHGALHRALQRALHAGGHPRGDPRHPGAAARLRRRTGKPGSIGAWRLLLIGCPCALVLSIPAAITSGIAAGARRGLLIKAVRPWGDRARPHHRLRQDRHADRGAAADNRPCPADRDRSHTAQSRGRRGERLQPPDRPRHPRQGGGRWRAAPPSPGPERPSLAKRRRRSSREARRGGFTTPCDGALRAAEPSHRPHRRPGGRGQDRGRRHRGRPAGRSHRAA